MILHSVVLSCDLSIHLLMKRLDYRSHRELFSSRFDSFAQTFESIGFPNTSGYMVQCSDSLKRDGGLIPDDLLLRLHDHLQTDSDALVSYSDVPESYSDLVSMFSDSMSRSISSLFNNMAPRLPNGRGFCTMFMEVDTKDKESNSRIFDSFLKSPSGSIPDLSSCGNPMMYMENVKSRFQRLYDFIYLPYSRAFSYYCKKLFNHQIDPYSLIEALMSVDQVYDVADGLKSDVRYLRNCFEHSDFVPHDGGWDVSMPDGKILSFDPYSLFMWTMFIKDKILVIDSTFLLFDMEVFRRMV